MPNMRQIDPKTASGATKEAFDEAVRQFGGVINLFRVAGTPAATQTAPLLATQTAPPGRGDLSR